MGTLVLSGDTSGAITLDAPAVAGSTTQTLVAVTDTLAPVVRSTLQTAPFSTNTRADFTDVPPWAKRVTVLFQNVSTSTATNPGIALQLGTSGGMVASGYLGATSSISGAGSVNTLVSFSTNFQFIQTTSANNISHGRVVFENITGNTWVATGQLAQSDATRVSWISGAIVLGAALTQVRFTTVGGTDTFDAGSIVNILYE